MSGSAAAAGTGEPPVLADRDGGVLRLTLNRPARRNAMDGAGWEALLGHLESAATDDEVRCVVLAGAGGTFCAGADISAIPAGHPLPRMTRIHQVPRRLFDLPKPVVARVEGHAVGAGWSLALACDLVVASSSASFSQVFVARGLTPDLGGSFFLPRLAGLQQAKRLAFLSDFVDAAEARDLGLVTWVVEPDEIDGFVGDLTARLAAQPPIALAQTKSLLNAGAAVGLGEALADEARAQAVNHATADAEVAMEAFRSGSKSAEFGGRWRLEE
jgi:enoyl-CoA hydratase/carnithine racemase